MAENKCRITVHRGLVDISPTPRFLREELTVRRRERQQDRGKTRYVENIEKLYSTFDHLPGGTITYEGLLDRILDFCRDRDIPYELTDTRTPPPEPEWERLRGFSFRQGQDDITALIASSRAGGIIECPGGYGKTFVISLLARLFDGLFNILVVTSQIPAVNSIAERVREKLLFGKVAKVGGKGKGFFPSASVVVCSRSSLHKVPDDWPGLLIYDEVHGAGARATAESLSVFSNAVKWGFSATPSGRHDNSDRMVEALFGKVRYCMDYEEARGHEIVVPIEVRMVPVHGQVEAKSDIGRLLKGIVYNTPRNKEIETVARNVPDGRKVLIMTATAEHAILLHSILPEYTLNFGTLSKSGYSRLRKRKIIDENWKRPSAKGLLEKFRSGEVMKVISTPSWGEAVDFPDLSVLIRCDGRRGEIGGIQKGLRLSRTTEGKTGAVLIDFDDRFGDVFISRTRDRIRHYRKQGWNLQTGYPDWRNLPV